MLLDKIWNIATVIAGNGKNTTGRIQGSKEVLSSFSCSLLNCQEPLHRPASRDRVFIVGWNWLPEDVMSHPWKCWMTGWIALWATWSNARCPCLCQRDGTRWSLRFVPTQTIPWFYDLLWNTTSSLTYQSTITSLGPHIFLQNHTRVNTWNQRKLSDFRFLKIKPILLSQVIHTPRKGAFCLLCNSVNASSVWLLSARKWLQSNTTAGNSSTWALGHLWNTVKGIYAL